MDVQYSGPQRLPLPTKMRIVIDLDRLAELMNQFIAEQPPHDRLEMRLRFSAFLSWLQKRQEATNGEKSNN